MFGQKGYFRHFPCPYYTGSPSTGAPCTCTRAHCPFRHLDSDIQAKRVREQNRPKLDQKEAQGPNPSPNGQLRLTENPKQKESAPNLGTRSSPTKQHNTQTDRSSKSKASRPLHSPDHKIKIETDKFSSAPSNSSSTSSSTNKHSKDPYEPSTSRTGIKKHKFGDWDEGKDHNLSLQLEELEAEGKGEKSTGEEFSLDEIEEADLEDYKAYDSDSSDPQSPSKLEEECRQIFNQYKEKETTPRTSDGGTDTEARLGPTKTKASDEYVIPSKRIRVSHVQAGGSSSTATLIPKKKSHLTPKEALAARYALVSSNTGIGLPAAAPSPKISAVPNIQAYLNKKPATVPSTTTPTPTLARTVDKGSKRVPHQPKIGGRKTGSATGGDTGSSSAKPPSLSTASLLKYSKIPRSTRELMISKIWTELKKSMGGDLELLTTTTLEHEESIAGRGSSKGTYVNLGMNLVGRLRKEAEVGPRTTPSLPLKSQSHLSTLAGAAGARTSWSIEKRASIGPGTGTELYTKLLDYVLSPADLKANGYPWEKVDGNPSTIKRQLNSWEKSKKKYCTPVPGPNYRICDRCSELYEVDPGTGLNPAPATDQICTYHWGRSWKGSSYSCCKGDPNSPGCAVGDVHVPVSPVHIPGFVSPIHEAGEIGKMGTDPWDIVAIDCEMIYTTWGTELGRVTVVGADKGVLYDTLVRPVHRILDYNTRWSGIDEKTMAPVTTTILDVQAVLLTMLKKNSILIGHSLESDLYALKLKHEFVIDTSLLIPHPLGPPFKRALRKLAEDCLGKIIQTGEGGHDSQEDALTALEVVLWKLTEDGKAGGRKGQGGSVCNKKTGHCGPPSLPTPPSPGNHPPNDKYHYVKKH